MTNYADLPSVNLVQHEIGRFVFNNEKPDDLAQHLNQIIIDLIQQHGFKDCDSQCVVLLQMCLIDFYKDFLIRLKQHIDSFGSSIPKENAFERTLNDVLSINLQELYLYMEKKD